MWFKYPIIILLFFFFSLLQTSFLPYFSIMGAVPNLVFALFFLLVFFQSKAAYIEGCVTSVIAGLFLDVFLPPYFGISIFIILAIYLLNILVNYFIKESQGRYLIFYFIFMFSVSFIAYSGLIHAASFLFNFEANFGPASLIALAYSLAFACPGFYLARIIFSINYDNQLKLL